MHEFVAGTKIEAEKVNENFDEQGLLIDGLESDVAALQAAPPAHATRHASGGADPLYKTGSDSFTTDGSGAASEAVSHGLGTTPSVVVIQMTSGSMGFTPVVTVKNASSFTVVFIGGAGFSGYAYDWIAFR